MDGMPRQRLDKRAMVTKGVLGVIECHTCSPRRGAVAYVDETAWEMPYGTESQSFKKPDTGKIATKVINHHGDEALNVYNVTGS